MARISEILKGKLAYFRPSPDRKKYKKAFEADLDENLRNFAMPAGLIGMVAWLDFAFTTDGKLHPEFPELFIFRMGLSAVGLLVFMLSFVPAFRKFSHLGAKLVYGYAFLSCSWFTGRIAEDANYVSGLQILILMAPIFPAALKHVYAICFLSAVLFLSSVFWYKPNLGNASQHYSMNNLVISYVISMAFSYFLYRIRFDSFLRQVMITAQKDEISEKMHQVNLLKTQQDGDYFLTSQLLQPLGRNEYQGKELQLDFLTEQKKKFHFKKWSSEIGGDLSTAQLIKLRGKEYLAFLNADAMGKSIQGAGGAIVIGTVFKSIMVRTAISEESKFTFPEIWLSNCYLELDQVLTGFDGSMLVSAIIGLIDVTNGFLYYINAEHPWLALYRDKTASFIENELYMRKLGTPESDMSFRVKTFRLLPGDVLFAGSDGRDDILIHKKDSTPLMNHDENAFLKNIEKAEGNLDKLRQTLSEMGEVTDDLSLIRIEYPYTSTLPLDQTCHEIALAGRENRHKGNLGDAETILRKGFEANPENLSLMKELAITLARNRNFAEAAKLAEKSSEIDPSDAGMLLLAGKSFLLSGKQEKAKLLKSADYGQRLLLREPKSVDALLLLSEIYLRLNKIERAEKYLSVARLFVPQNKKLIALDQKADLIKKQQRQT